MRTLLTFALTIAVISFIILVTWIAIYHIKVLDFVLGAMFLSVIIFLIVNASWSIAGAILKKWED